MRILLSVVFLCLCISTQAQKKNEIRIGLPSIYYFDETPYMFHTVIIGKRRIPPPTYFGYSRLLTKTGGLSIDYKNMWLVYAPFSPNNTPDEIIRREFNDFSISWYKQFTSNRIKIIGKAGISYRDGGEVVHLFSILLPDGTPWEEKTDVNKYNNFGGKLDIQTKFRVAWNLNIFAEVGLAGYFSKHSPYQLNNLIGLSYEF